MANKQLDSCPGRLEHHKFISPAVRRSHEILGIRMGAPEQKIQKAYQTLSELMQPTQDPNGRRSSGAFEQIHRAFQIASNPEKIKELNRNYLSSVSDQLQLGGRTFDGGSFYGLRRYTSSNVSVDEIRPLLPGSSFARSVTDEKQRRKLVLKRRARIDEDASILDQPEWDTIEILLGGSYRREDEQIEVRSFHEEGLDGLEETPWVLSNLTGYEHFMNGRYLQSAEIFRRLNERIPNNMIFLYREGLSLEAWACAQIRRQNKTVRSMKEVLHLALDRYRKAIQVGRNRPPGERQQAVSIRKAFADLHETLGYRSRARSEWNHVLDVKPRSVEGKEKERKLRPVRFYLRKVETLLAGS